MRGIILFSHFLACCAASTDNEFQSHFAKNEKPVKLYSKASFLSSAKVEMGQSVTVSSRTFSKFRQRRFPARLLDRLKGAFTNLIRITIISPAKKLKNLIRPIRSNKIESVINDDIKASQKLSTRTVEKDFEPSHWIPVLTIPLLLSSNKVWIPVSVYQNAYPNVSSHAKDDFMTVAADRAVRSTYELVENARGAVVLLHSDLMATKSVTPEGAFGAYFLVILLSLLYFLVLGKYLSMPLLRYLLRVVGHEKAVGPLLIRKSHDSVHCNLVLKESVATSYSTEEAVEKLPVIISPPSESLQGQLSKYDDDAGNIDVPEDDDDSGLFGLLQRKYAHRSEAKEGFEEDDDMSNQYLTSPSMTGSTDSDEFPVVMPLVPLEGVTLPRYSLVLSTDTEEDTALEFEVPVKTPTRPTRMSEAVLPTPDLNDKSVTETKNESRPCDVQKVFEESIYSPDTQTSSSPTKKAAIKVFTCVNPFDQNGVILYLTSPARLAVRKTSIVRSRMSSIFIGSEETVIAHTSHDLGLTSFPNYTTNVGNSWCAIDLGVGRRLRPTKYCIRHGASSIGNALRSWELRGREKDRDEWDILKVHINDNKLNNAPYSVALWDIESTDGKRNCPSIGCTPETTTAAGQLVGQTLKGYRYFLLVQTDVNSSGNHCLFIGGLELYGILMER